MTVCIYGWNGFGFTGMAESHGFEKILGFSKTNASGEIHIRITANGSEKDIALYYNGTEKLGECG